MIKSKLDILSGQPIPLSQVLMQRAKSKYHENGYEFIQDSGKLFINFEALLQKAKLIAALIQQHTEKADRVLLIYPPGLDYIIAFFATILSGRIAVPLYPPTSASLATMLQNVIEDCSPSALLSNSNTLQSLQEVGEQVSWLDTSTISSQRLNNYEDIEIKITDIALIQYTSGSTSAPKGVCVSHENLFNNLRLQTELMGTSHDHTMISWLPPFHDMGLIGAILQCCYAGINGHFIAPTTFIRSPFKWLKLISDHKHCISPAPNFAYDLCVKKITPEKKKELDLSHWDVILCGAEPVQEQVIEKFFNYFADCGIKKENFFPSYGLAEGTLIVSGRYGLKCISKHEIIKNNPSLVNLSNSLVSCGYAKQELIIIDRDKKVELPLGQIGEIAISGLSVTPHYWNNRDEETSFTQINNKRYFLTGDYGLLKNGELYISGRIKETIIIAGKKYFPHDIEITIARKIAHIKKDRIIVFGVNDGITDRLVIAFEANRNYLFKKPKVLVDKIQQLIVESLNIAAKDIFILKPGQIKKTTSGKIKRIQLKNDYQSNSLTYFYVEHYALETNNNTKNQHPFIRIIKEILAIPPSQAIDTSKKLSNIGIDSLGYIELQDKLNENYPEIAKKNNLTELGETKNIDEAIKYIEEKQLTVLSRKINKVRKLIAKLELNFLTYIMNSHSRLAKALRYFAGMKHVMGFKKQSEILPTAKSYIENLDIKVKYHNTPEISLYSKGPLIIVANHPTGLSDTITIINHIAKVRSDIKIAGNHLLGENNLDKFIIPINLYGTDLKENADALNKMKSWLLQQNVLVITPAGRPSHVDLKKLKHKDFPWKEAFLPIRTMTQAKILPVHIKTKPVTWFIPIAKLSVFIVSIYLFHLTLSARKHPYDISFGRIIEPDEDVSLEQLYQFCNGDIEEI